MSKVTPEMIAETKMLLAKLPKPHSQSELARVLRERAAQYGLQGPEQAELLSALQALKAG